MTSMKCTVRSLQTKMDTQFLRKKDMNELHLGYELIKNIIGVLNLQGVQLQHLKNILVSVVGLVLLGHLKLVLNKSDQEVHFSLGTLTILTVK